METKYQIFISSTYEDLKEERKKVEDTILSMYHFPIGMEMFSAADEEQWEIIRETIDSSDYYVLIIGHRYGSVIKKGDEAGISYTQKEFRYAIERHIPVLAFLIDKSVAVTPDKMECDAAKKDKLQVFIEEVMTERMIEYWTSKEDLANKVMNALNKQFNRGKRPGWVRAERMKLEEMQAELVEMSKKIRKLEEENAELRKNVVEKMPELTVAFEGISKIAYHSVSINDVEAEYLPITEETLSDSGLMGKISKQEIDEYNDSLPSETELRKYLEEWKVFRSIEKNKLPFTVRIDNQGNCKANDVNVRVIVPEGMIILDGDMLKDLKEPEKLSTKENPIDKYFTKKFFGAAEMALSNSYLNMGLGGLSGILPSITARNSSINNSETVEDNCLHIWIRNLLHTECYQTEELYLVPIMAGKFDMEIRIICEEYEKEVVQKFELNVERG